MKGFRQKRDNQSCISDWSLSVCGENALEGPRGRPVRTGKGAVRLSQCTVRKDP